jgi:hypothetical protein
MVIMVQVSIWETTARAAGSADWSLTSICSGSS